MSFGENLFGVSSSANIQTEITKIANKNNKTTKHDRAVMYSMWPNRLNYHCYPTQKCVLDEPQTCLVRELPKLKLNVAYNNASKLSKEEDRGCSYPSSVLGVAPSDPTGNHNFFCNETGLVK